MVVKSIRSLLRAPLSLPDSYRALSKTYPRSMNFYYTYIAIVGALFFGKGIEKLSMKGEQTAYER
jgi:hypothetical protein